MAEQFDTEEAWLAEADRLAKVRDQAEAAHRAHVSTWWDWLCRHRLADPESADAIAAAALAGETVGEPCEDPAALLVTAGSRVWEVEDNRDDSVTATPLGGGYRMTFLD